MHECVSGWMGGQIDGPVNRGVDGWMGWWVMVDDGQTHGQLSRWVDGLVDGWWIERQTDG